MPRGNGRGTWVSQLVVVVDRRNGRNDFGVDVLQDSPILEGKNDVIEKTISTPTIDSHLKDLPIMAWIPGPRSHRLL
jgi:hypothetical protein